MKTEKDKRMLIREKGSMPFGQKSIWGPHPRSTCPQAPIHGLKPRYCYLHLYEEHTQKYHSIKKKRKNTHTNTC